MRVKESEQKAEEKVEDKQPVLKQHISQLLYCMLPLKEVLLRCGSVFYLQVVCGFLIKRPGHWASETQPSRLTGLI